MITIHTLTYNEELIIEFFIQHYRKNFPNCIINIFDNESTDKTVEIAKSYNCNIITYKTNNTLSDLEYLKIKNNCWKNATTEWVVVCDCDELLELNENDLLNEINNDTTIIKPEGYSLMNNNERINLDSMNFGFRDFGFDKCVMFDSKKINEINYSPGGHSCSPIGIVKYNFKKYRLLHYKYLSPKYSVERHKMFGERLSQDNKQRGWGVHYTFSSDSIIEFYKNKQNELIKLL